MKAKGMSFIFSISSTNHPSEKKGKKLIRRRFKHQFLVTRHFTSRDITTHTHSCTNTHTLGVYDASHMSNDMHLQTSQILWRRHRMFVDGNKIWNGNGNEDEDESGGNRRWRKATFLKKVHNPQMASHVYLSRIHPTSPRDNVTLDVVVNHLFFLSPRWWAR